MLRRLALLVALALGCAAAQAQTTYHIDRASVPTTAATAPDGPASFAIAGRLPDFSASGYQLCVASGTAASAPVTPQVERGTVTVHLAALPAAASRATLVYVVRAGTPCDGRYDKQLTNAVVLPSGATPLVQQPVTTKVASVGTIVASPNPVKAPASTTLTAQFSKDPATPGGAPEPGAPSGTVTFSAAGQTLPTTSLTLDKTAVFKPQSAIALTMPTAATPVFTPAAGTYVGTQSISLSDATTSALIYYTTDGSTPTAASNLYGAPLSVTATETINAIAIAAGYLNSTVASATYTITFGAASQLAFTTEPSDTALTKPITPAVTVAVEDTNGNLVGNSALPVTIAIAANPVEGTLSGTRTVNAVNGVATFADLNINNIGTGYTLSATAPGVSAVTSTAFNVIAYPITLNLPGALIGVGATLPGSFTLTNPATEGGVTVNLASSNTQFVTITPATVTVAAGGTTGSFTYTGGAQVGQSTLTASATGYTDGTATVSTTNSLISLGAIPVIAPGQTVDLPLSLATAAPPGGITVKFTSSNPRIATITPNIFIPAGQSIAATNPQITGVTSGTTVISANATGYAPYVSIPPATVTVTATFPGSITINQSSGYTIQLSISYPAPVGGITFTLSSDDTTKVTLPASVTIAAGASSVQVPLTGVATGTTTIRADSPGITEATSSVNVNSTIYFSDMIIGNKLETAQNIGLAVAPPTPITVTITSNGPSIATISKDGTVVGGTTLTFTNVTSSFVGTVYVQGKSINATTLTISAPGYAPTTANITVYPSGFVINSYELSFSTTTFSSPTALTVYPSILNPTTLTYNTTSTLAPGVGPVSVPVTSSTPATGTVASPLTYNTADTQQNIMFTPKAAGTTNITLGTPAGFSTPSQYQASAATVTAPPINVNDVIAGLHLESSFGVSLGATPPSAVTVTVTSNNPAIAKVSTDPTVAGGTSITFPNITGYAGNVYVQGIGLGTTTLTITAPGFATATSNVSVYPSGFVINSYQLSFSTTTFSTPNSLTVYPAILNPTTLTYYTTSTLSPGVGPVNVTVTSSTPATGTVTSPLTYNTADTQQNLTFTPKAAGTTNITLGTPAGFSAPTQYQTSAATVTAPPINTNDVTTGVKLQAGVGIGLTQTPPNPVTVTITSSNPAVAKLSTSSTATGSASLTFTNITSGPGTIYVQGLSVGTSTLTTSAPGFATSTNTITVYPSGFVINPYSGSFTTTTFSGPQGFSVVPALLDPTTMNFSNFGTLSPGVGPVTVALTDSNVGIGTLTNVPLTFNTGDTGQNATFNPVAAGATTLAVVPPAGFSTPANYQSIVATVTAPYINTNDLVTGVKLEGGIGISLSQNPPNPVTVTVISNGPAIAAISSDPTMVGGTTVTFPNVTSGGVGTLYVQGLTLGTTTLTISAPGYSNAISHITVQPSGFLLNTGSFSTSVANGPSQIQVVPYVLNTGTLTTYGYPTTLSPTAGAVSVSVTSSNADVGTISNAPLMFNGDSTSTDTGLYATFTPLASGTSTISIGTPAGFSTPSAGQQININVQ